MKSNDTLFVTDLDGTLLDDTSRVSQRSVSILNRLSEQGAMITVATARTPATVEPLLHGIKSRVPAIVMTGAAMWNRDGLSYENVKYLEAGVAEKVAALCRSNGVNPFIYTLNPMGMLHVYHNGDCRKGEKRFIEERSHLALKRFILDSPHGLAPYIEGTVLMFAMGPKDAIFDVAEKIRANVDCSVSAYVDIFGADTGILEVFSAGVSKAAAIKQLAEKTGARKIVVFGDNLNDIPMMKIADESYAVENALDEVKETATGVIGSNRHDSVALKIASLAGIEVDY